MKHFTCTALALVLASFTMVVSAADNPDASFFKKAAEGGLSEVQLGTLAQSKSPTPSVKEFGSMMVTDHTAANEKLKAIAASKGIELPTSPSVGQMATKAKLDVLSGSSFDKSYIQGMVEDHEETIKLFQSEAAAGQDADAKAFATATLPTLKTHLKKIRTIATAQGVPFK
jgi:putative membrane protein